MFESAHLFNTRYRTDIVLLGPIGAAGRLCT